VSWRSWVVTIGWILLAVALGIWIADYAGWIEPGTG